MENNFKRHKNTLDRNKTGLLIIDIQERILGVMQNSDRVIENTTKLIKGFKTLDIPIFYTEQYPKGLGETAKDLKVELEGIDAVQKMSFSCCGAGNLFQLLVDKNISQVVIAGIESHVCVQQTVMDLLENEFQVNICADAVSSRKKIDYKTALHRMRDLGANVTTSEAVLFELLNVCGTDEFKKISKIVK